jgi:hypothetical protein
MKKPKCKLTGQDGNIFSLLACASKCLRENGLQQGAKDMQEKVLASSSYEEALCIIMEYVEAY